ncbi:uncharacterized protein PAE49_002165 [Odontesthes bonariensis]|uniref:uncharacterized protein LOC142375259 n=1 Tax=Odontesthes bonariensis TaxID=219752 RepID=UPI003F58F99A
MIESKPFKFSLFLTWMLPFTALTQQFPNKDVTVGDDVTLPCEGFKEFHDECNSITWIFTAQRAAAAVPLFEDGKFHRDAQTKSDRLSVTASCSLVIKKVTGEDAGRYDCRQYDESGKKFTDSAVKLSVSNRVDTTTTATTTTITPLTSATAAPAVIDTDTDIILYSSVAVGVAALLVTVLLIIRWKRNKCDRTQMGDKAELSLHPVMAQSDPETGQDTTEAADAVAYASINYNNIPKAGGRAQHEEDMVTYSTVKAASAGASDDPSNLYASTVIYSVTKPPSYL